MKPGIAYAMLARARAEGYTFALTTRGTISVHGPPESGQEELDDLLDRLREHKPTLLELLGAMPSLGGV